jgi:hypothetical protein
LSGEHLLADARQRAPQLAMPARSVDDLAEQQQLSPAADDREQTFDFPGQRLSVHPMQPAGGEGRVVTPSCPVAAAAGLLESTRYAHDPQIR